jgi:hypothetical protein
MSKPVHDNKDYRAYLVRMWPVNSGGQTVWRASVEDAHSGERRAFADLPQLFAFLQEITLNDPAPIQDKEHSHD